MSVAVRQYATASLIDPLVANPGPTVDAVHLLAYGHPTADAALTPAGGEDYHALCRDVRENDLGVIPGFRLGNLGPDPWLDPQFWKDAADLFREASGERDADVVALDQEDYAGGADLTLTWLTSVGKTLADLETLAAPLVEVAQRLGVTVGLYPVGADSALPRVFRNAGVSVECWTEVSFSYVSTWKHSTAAHQGYLETEAEDRATLEALGCTWRRGYQDDYLRFTGDEYRAAHAGERAWVFDRYRNDRDVWGQAPWLAFTSHDSLNDGLIDAWSCNAQSPVEHPPRTILGADLTLEWDMKAPGYQTDHFVKHPDHWAPRGLWSAKGNVSRSTDETWAFTFEAVDLAGKVPICGIWWASGTNQSWCLYVEDGDLKGRFSGAAGVQDHTFGALALGPVKLAVRQDANGYEVDHPGGKTVFALAPKLGPVTFYAGVVQNLPGDQNRYYLGRNGLSGHLCHWNRKLTDGEITRAHRRFPGWE